ncbi:MAG: tetratricopeptide repeat protein [Bryobacteraceae bacterium]
MRFDGKVLWAALAILTLSACNLTPQAREARFLEKGKKEFDRHNYAVAILHFKNAAEARPFDAEPYYQLGLSHAAIGDFKSANAELTKATFIDPKHIGAQLKLAQLLSNSRLKESVEEAQKHAKAVLALQPDNPDALDVLAVTDLKLGKPESAQSYAEQAVSKSPGHLPSWVMLAAVKLARQDVAGAEQSLQRACTQLPKSPEARFYLGDFYLSHGRAPEAEQQYRQALAIDPKYGPALMNLGAMQAKAGQTDQADQTFRQVSALPDRRYKPVHAEYLFQIGKREQGLAELEKAAAADPGDLNVRAKLLDAYLALHRVGDAEKVLTAAIKKNGIDQDALLRRSRIYLDTGKYSEAEADLSQVLHFRKDSAEAHYLLSKVAKARANPSMLKQELEEAVKIDPGFLMARVDLASTLVAEHSARFALQILNEAPREQQDNGALVLQRNWVLLALGERADARKGIDRVLATSKVPEALLQDAVFKMGEKNYDGARKSAEEALAGNPQDVRALFWIVQTYAAQKQTPAGIQKVREYAEKQPSSADVQLFLGQVLASSGDRAGARKAYEAAKAARPGSLDADFALVQLDMAEGKREDVRKSLTDLVAAHPDNKTGHQLLAQLETISGNNAAAIEQYRKLVALDGKDATALNALAYTLAEDKKPDEALGYAQKARELAPDNPAVADTLGWIYYLQGRYEPALVQLGAANNKEASAVREYHLAMAYLKAGKPELGRQSLNAALKMNPNLPEAQVARQAFGIGAQ